jgi:hypothetical protein
MTQHIGSEAWIEVDKIVPPKSDDYCANVRHIIGTPAPQPAQPPVAVAPEKEMGLLGSLTVLALGLLWYLGLLGCAIFGLRYLWRIL